MFVSLFCSFSTLVTLEGWVFPLALITETADSAINIRTLLHSEPDSVNIALPCRPNQPLVDFLSLTFYFSDRFLDFFLQAEIYLSFRNGFVKIKSC